MKGYTKWSDLRPVLVERAGGEEAVAEGVSRLIDRIRAHRLAETRRRLALTQAEVAERMGVVEKQVDHIETGKVFTIDALSRYVSALGGELRLIADFDEETILVGTEDFLRMLTREDRRQQAIADFERLRENSAEWEAYRDEAAELERAGIADLRDRLGSTES